MLTQQLVHLSVSHRFTLLMVVCDQCACSLEGAVTQVIFCSYNLQTSPEHLTLADPKCSHSGAVDLFFQTSWLEVCSCHQKHLLSPSNMLA